MSRLFIAIFTLLMAVICPKPSIASFNLRTYELNSAPRQHLNQTITVNAQAVNRAGSCDFQYVLGTVMRTSRCQLYMLVVDTAPILDSYINVSTSINVVIAPVSIDEMNSIGDELLNSQVARNFTGTWQLASNGKYYLAVNQ